MCSLCGEVAFCSQEHWRLHSNGSSCFPYQIEYQEGVGRRLVATKQINPGETVFEEEAIAVGPNQESGPLCLGCMAAVDGSFTCERCGYPLCDKECGLDPCHR